MGEQIDEVEDLEDTVKEISSDAWSYLMQGVAYTLVGVGSVYLSYTYSMWFLLATIFCGLTALSKFRMFMFIHTCMSMLYDILKMVAKVTEEEWDKYESELEQALKYAVKRMHHGQTIVEATDRLKSDFGRILGREV